MVDWNMDQPGELSNSGQKTAVFGVTMPPPLAWDVSASRTRVGQPSTAQAREALFQSAVSTALGGLAAIESETQRIAVKLRDADIATANRDLASLVETIRSLMTLTARLDRVAGHSVHEAEFCAAPSVGGVLGTVASAVKSLLACRATNDRTLTAESLERELVPAFAYWKSVLGAVGARCVV